MDWDEPICALTDAQHLLAAGPLICRSFVMSDAHRVALLANDARVSATTTRLPHPYTLAHAKAWLGTHQEARMHAESLIWAIEGPDGMGLVGAISVDIEVADRRGILGYWIGVDHWGRGYATRAAKAVTQRAFALGIEKMEANTLADNIGSAKVLERCGYSREGLRRSHAVRSGRRCDVALWGLVAPGAAAKGQTPS